MNLSFVQLIDEFELKFACLTYFTHSYKKRVRVADWDNQPVPSVLLINARRLKISLAQWLSLT